MFTNLITPRLILRRLKVSDCEAVFAYRTHPDVYRYQNWEPHTREDVEDFIYPLTKMKPDTPGTWLQLGITLADSGQLIGDFGMHFLENDDHQVEVGITLSPQYQKQGYALEALEGGFAYLFDTLGKHRVFCSVDPSNQSSISLMERAGMRKEAHLKESMWFKGKWVDDVIYALIDWEWRLR